MRRTLRSSSREPEQPHTLQGNIGPHNAYNTWDPAEETCTVRAGYATAKYILGTDYAIAR